MVDNKIKGAFFSKNIRTKYANTSESQLFQLLEEYLEPYPTTTRVRKLDSILYTYPSIKIPVLKLALKYVKKTTNIEEYKCIHAQINNNLHDLKTVNEDEWVKETEDWARLKLENLRYLAEQANNNKVKRSNIMDTVDIYLSLGDYQLALRKLGNLKEYNLPALTPEYHMKAAEIHFQLKNWENTCKNTAKVLGKSDDSIDKHLLVQAQLMHAFALLNSSKSKSGRVYEGIETLLSINLQDFASTSDLFTSIKDVAFCITLSSVKYFSRTELKELLDDARFQDYETAAPECRGLVSSFLALKYDSFYDVLKQNETTIGFNDWIIEDISTTLMVINHRAVLAYVYPFSSIELKTMACSFNTDITTVERLVRDVLMQHNLGFKIDGINKILNVSNKNLEALQYEKTEKLVGDFYRNAKIALLNSLSK
ncbi:hypothetical protein NADFUDRAFT_51822 [Nadsonia fulvescens var. elongata DSM 6958]|uniref:PCI domain-containing protein n=1 Tax=Nadsonia fulvescens var. elongata DSM 6958 TaxID=857566 RepID=A0A1E3PK60_9ASCO|nr:hypothetical protein NADFUDRAFT_51822 [Nadsonia fulvescens var. elongata DSM 6958]